MQSNAQEYQALDLEAHGLLQGIPLHDVWTLDLPGRPQERTTLDVLEIFRYSKEKLTSPLVGLLFWIRNLVGRLFGWDEEEGFRQEASLLGALEEDFKRRSLVAPGTRLGPFQIVYALPGEWVGEVRNATVHAFTCQVLRAHPGGYRFYWAIYVVPVSRWTSLYMRVIDPFRKWIVYPTILKKLVAAW